MYVSVGEFWWLVTCKEVLHVMWASSWCFLGVILVVLGFVLNFLSSPTYVLSVFVWPEAY